MQAVANAGVMRLGDAEELTIGAAGHKRLEVVYLMTSVRAGPDRICREVASQTVSVMVVFKDERREDMISPEAEQFTRKQ